MKKEPNQSLITVTKYTMINAHPSCIAALRKMLADTWGHVDLKLWKKCNNVCTTLTAVHKAQHELDKAIKKLARIDLG